MEAPAMMGTVQPAPQRRVFLCRFLYLRTMPALRPAIPYTLTTASTVVTATAFQGIEDAITHLHQRGKVVLCAVGNNVRGGTLPLFGMGNAGIHTYQGPREMAVVFQVPSGYNRFSLSMGIHFPQVLTNGGVVRKPVSSAGFRYGEAYYPIFDRDYAINSSQTIYADGEIPIPPNSGQVQQMAISMGIAVNTFAGDPLPVGTTIMSLGGNGWGFYYLCMSVYKDDQC